MQTQTDTAATADNAMPMPSDESPSIEDVLAEAGEAEVTPAADPITHESVQSNKAPEESLPDSSLIADRMKKKVEQVHSQKQHAEQQRRYEAEQEELRVLRALRFGEPQEKTQEAQDDKDAVREERIRALEARLEAQDRKAEQDRQRQEMLDEQNDVVAYVTENKQYFPMLNKLGHQALVYQKMRNEQYRTGSPIGEAQAGREVEAEIVDIVHQCAPLLGYTKSNEAPRREEKVSVGTPNMTIADPIDVGDLDEDEAIKAIVSEYETNLR